MLVNIRKYKNNITGLNAYDFVELFNNPDIEKLKKISHMQNWYGDEYTHLSVFQKSFQLVFQENYLYESNSRGEVFQFIIRADMFLDAYENKTELNLDIINFRYIDDAHGMNVKHNYYPKKLRLELSSIKNNQNINCLDVNQK